MVVGGSSVCSAANWIQGRQNLNRKPVWDVNICTCDAPLQGANVRKDAPIDNIYNGVWRKWR